MPKMHIRRRALLSFLAAGLLLATLSSRSSARQSLVAQSGGVPATPGAVDVRRHAATGEGTVDETAAFEAAMRAALDSPVRRLQGPGGSPQAVVYVPPGTYRLLGLEFESDVRLEVDAGAVLEQAGGRGAQISGGGREAHAPALVSWDRPVSGPPLKNVSIVGVNWTNDGIKAGSPVEEGWDLGGSFTLNLDPASTGANNAVAAVELNNVDGFLIENAFSIQNDTPSSGYKWPTTSRAAIIMRARRDSPLGGPIYDPRNGHVVNHYNVHSPRGYGPNQVNSAHNVTFSHIYSSGGTALRLETDGAERLYGSEIRGVRADTITGVNCNRAVSFAPHDQNNYDVHVTGVLAKNCYQGIIESIGERLSIDHRGGFYDSTVDGALSIGGKGAQRPDDVDGWRSGLSRQAYAKDLRVWNVIYSNVSCSGTFERRSSRLMFSTALIQPRCS